MEHMDGERREVDVVRGLTHRWVVRAPGVGASGLVERVLGVRGLTDAGARERFLEPSLKDLHDPGLMPGIDRAASRMLEAMHAGDRIAIYGDYDVDGITATAILYRTIIALSPGASVDTFIPHRDEGYGLSNDGINGLADAGARVIVSVDCGITAIEPAEAALRRGVDLIITDHHNPPSSEGELPRAFAIVHPRAPGSRYPFADLCGAGVAFKLAWRLATMHAGSDRVSDGIRSLLVELLAPAALGAIADVVPLVGENRVIARHGLPRVAHSPFVGIRALVDASGLSSDKVDAEDVGFRLAPRINACGRMGHAREALELMLTDDEAEARRIAQHLSRENERRRGVERAVVEQACGLVDEAGLDGRRSIVLAHAAWARGVVGLAASRLVDRYCRPTVMLRLENGMAYGSARSIDGFNMHAGLEACAAHLSTWGGHDAAAGLSVEARKFEAFREAFEAHAASVLREEDLVPTVHVDCDAMVEELTVQGVEALERLAPFGAANPRVRTRLRGVRVAARPDVIGRDGKHIKVTFDGAKPMRVVAWGWARHLDELEVGRELDVVVQPKVSRWGGRVSVEPELVDVVGRGG